MADERDLPSAFLVFGVGGAVTVFGGALVRRGVVKYRRQQQTATAGGPYARDRHGPQGNELPTQPSTAVASDLPYKDRHGQPYQGESYLLPEEVEGLRTGDTGVVRYDPNTPADSIWVGDKKR